MMMMVMMMMVMMMMVMMMMVMMMMVMMMMMNISIAITMLSLLFIRERWYLLVLIGYIGIYCYYL